MTRMPIRIVKVGGSLLDLVDLSDRVHAWLAAEQPAHHVLVAGGGALVDQVRQWDQQASLSVEAAHWMCVDLMTVTAHMLHDRLRDIPLVEDDRLLCQRLGERGCTIFGPAGWMRHSEPYLPGTTLPRNWEVTSDSIAARLAITLAAHELVLLKSALHSGESDLAELSAGDYVDPWFSHLAENLPAMRFVDLRSHPPQEASYEPG